MTLDRLSTAVAFALYQLTVLVGIVLLPVGLLLGRVGAAPPVDRALRALDPATGGTESPG